MVNLLGLVTGISSVLCELQDDIEPQGCNVVMPVTCIADVLVQLGATFW